MIQLKSLIIDDEPSAREILKKFVTDTPGLILQKICSNAIEALAYLKDHEIDLLFLDINMPKLSGINFAKSLETSPMIIFTTAYPEYAVQGFELEAIDYLVKPIPFERFLKATNKAIEQYKLKNIPEIYNEKDNADSENTHITIKADRKMYRMLLSDILFFESMGDFVKIHTIDKVIIESNTLKNIEKKVNRDFVRIHKSYIIALPAISYLEGNLVRIGDKLLPIGNTYRESFIEKFRKMDLK